MNITYPIQNNRQYLIVGITFPVTTMIDGENCHNWICLAEPFRCFTRDYNTNSTSYCPKTSTLLFLHCRIIPLIRNIK